MKEIIENIIENTNPKQFSFSIKRNSELFKKCEEIKIKHECSTLVEAMYILYYDYNPVCKYGNRKKYITWNSGYGNCGKASSCLCSKEQVSSKVKDTKSKLSQEEKNKIQIKREKTNLKKYGVVNTGLLDKSRIKHKEFYENPENVSKQLKKWKNTVLERYGVDVLRHIDGVESKIKNTMIEKYGSENPSKNKDILEKRMNTVINKDSFYSDKIKYNFYLKTKEKFKVDHGLELLTTFDDYKTSDKNSKHRWKCLECSHVFDYTITYNKNKLKCSLCNPTEILYKSKAELEIFDYIKNELGVDNLVSGDRRLINPYELDIVDYQRKIAIEYCGLYYHRYGDGNFIIKDISYHKNKMKLANNKGFRLFTIFEDEWLEKKDVVKSILRHHFGQTSNKIGARKCKVKEISNNEAKNFFEKYHVMGGDTSFTKSYGLFFNKTLVSCMGFKNYGKAIPIEYKDSYKNGYNLIRFATNFSSIPGAATKLFSYFIKQNPEVDLVLTLADNRWSQGDLYLSMGFTKDKTWNPDYWYTLGQKRFHKFGFRKDKIRSKFGLDISGKTEFELMKELGYDRIYDCGKVRYKWKRN